MKSRRPLGMRLALGASLVIAGAAGVAYATGTVFGASANDPLVSHASFNESTTQITNNGGWGIFCFGAPSVAMITTGPGSPTFSGNGAGTENCPNA